MKNLAAWANTTEAIKRDFKAQEQIYRATNYPSREAGDITDLGLHSGTEKAAQERANVRKNLNPDVKIVKVEKVSNPAIVTKDVGFKVYEPTIEQLVKDGLITKEEKAELDKNKDLVEVRKLLQSKGYDGIIYRNEIEDIGHISQIAFPKEQ